MPENFERFVAEFSNGGEIPTISCQVSEQEQQEIVALCRQFKTNAQSFAQGKKERLRTCYAYSRNRFTGGDLLPVPSTQGNERDNNKSRPQVFIPLTRQQIKSIYSQLKLSIFPSDSDYFRVRSKNAAGAIHEDRLTEGLKYLFKEALISEKLGEGLYNLSWSGFFAIQPKIREVAATEWRCVQEYDEQSQNLKTRFAAQKLPSQLLPDIDVFNPLDFYIEPGTSDLENAGWVTIGKKKLFEIEENPVYFNKSKLRLIAQNILSESNSRKSLSIHSINDYLNQYSESSPAFYYDLYYFPYLKTSAGEYRNMIAGVANDQLLIRFHPNTFPKGLNPVVFCGWMYDTENPYSTGPAEDLIDLQKLINILYNYKIEVMARAGNRFAVRPNVDLSNFFGVAGGVAVTDDPRGDIVSYSGDFSEIASIDNTVGVLKAEAQIVAGAQTPFQGSSALDYQKTATELQILQENSISILREVIEHVSTVGIRQVLERLMYLIAEVYDEPVEVAIDNRQGERQYQAIDFSLLKSGNYTIELVGVNPSQSKQAQINSFMQLIRMLESDPKTLFIAEPIIQKIGELSGIKNISSLISDLKLRIHEMLPDNPSNEKATRGK